MDEHALPVRLAISDPMPIAAAELMLDAFADYNERFADITRRARRCFDWRDWRSSAANMRARITLYDECIRHTQGRLDLLLDDRLRSRALWASIRLLFHQRLQSRHDGQLYKTWFNTLVRRIFLIRGVDPRLEFLALQHESDDKHAELAIRRRYPLGDDVEAVFAAILDDFRHACSYVQPLRCAAALAQTFMQRAGTAEQVREIELLQVVFYRDRRAYLVGCRQGNNGARPLVIVLAQSEAGIYVDALLTESGQVSALFDYSHSYFHADIGHVGAVVGFMHELLPHKPLEELYTVLGRAKQGKTERFRRIFKHFQQHPEDRLVHAEGKRGMVMAVFTPRGLPLVFKLIRDHFAWPKEVNRLEVEQKYQLVLLHDRVGRLVDVQEFRQLRFPRALFEQALLDDLLKECAATVSLDDDDVVIAHCYVERRMRPLNLYLKEVDVEQAKKIIIDYGQAIKDLAGSNLFPGDMLLKNFGVSRSGRAIFYDYDEICSLSQCCFRSVPAPHPGEELLALEDRIYAAPGDVFPELFVHFLGVGAELRALLQAEHGELFDPAWWQSLQAKLRVGAYVDVPPYPPSARLCS